MPLLTVKSSDRNDVGTVITVTPRMAMEWLESQIVNRPLRFRTVEQYLSQFENGTWTCDPLLPLLFNEDGKLADGQHRLHAVVKHNRAVDFYVRTVSDTVLDAVCNSIPRNMRDRLQMHGVENSLHVASIGRIVMQRKLSGSMSIYSGTRTRTYLPSELIGVLEEVLTVDVNKFINDCTRIYSMQPARARIMTVKHIGYLLCQNYDVEPMLVRVCDEESPQNEASRAIRKHLLNFAYGSRFPHWPIYVVATTFNDGPRKIYRPADAVLEDLTDSVFSRLWPNKS